MTMKDDIEWTLATTDRRHRYTLYVCLLLVGFVLILISEMM